MTDLILPWAREFRELCADESLSDIDIISRFHLYIKQQEQELTKNWKQHNKEIQQEIEEERIKTDELIDNFDMEIPVTEEVDFDNEKDNFPK